MIFNQNVKILFKFYSNGIQPPLKKINQKLKNGCHTDKPTAFNTQR